VLKMNGSPGLVRRRIREMTASDQRPSPPPPPTINNHGSPSRSGITHINVTARPFRSTTAGGVSSSPTSFRPASSSNRWKGGSHTNNSTTVKPTFGNAARQTNLHAGGRDAFRPDTSTTKGPPPSSRPPPDLVTPKPFKASTEIVKSLSVREPRVAPRSSPDDPPELLPRRSKSSLSSPSKPSVPPKPLRLSGSKIGDTSPTVNAHQGSAEEEKNERSCETEEETTESPKRGTELKDENRSEVCDSPLNTSFTKFNQKIQKFDMLKKRHSYSEFEELIEKKRELRERMMSKIRLLREERDILIEEKKSNDAEGQRLLGKLEAAANSSEVEKFRQYLEEIEQITKLTVSLTIRLSRLAKRIESGKLKSDVLSSERRKESLLKEQCDEAENLHRNTDRRGLQIKKIVTAKLGHNETKEYEAFVENLIRLVTDLKETEQRIQLGEEQLIALNDNIPVTAISNAQ